MPDGTQYDSSQSGFVIERGEADCRKVGFQQTIPPFGNDQAPSYRPSQYGPPGWASNTSSNPPGRRNIMSPALDFCCGTTTIAV